MFQWRRRRRRCRRHSRCWLRRGEAVLVVVVSLMAVIYVLICICKDVWLSICVCECVCVCNVSVVYVYSSHPHTHTHWWECTLRASCMSPFPERAGCLAPRRCRTTFWTFAFHSLHSTPFLRRILFVLVHFVSVAVSVCQYVVAVCELHPLTLPFRLSLLWYHLQRATNKCARSIATF